MKLTIQQIKQIIKEELEEVYKGKDRIIYGPDTKAFRDVYFPEVGSYILPSKNPYEELHPEVKAKIPPSADEQTLKMAYELSTAMGQEIDMPVEDFIEAVKLSRDPDAVVREPNDTLKREKTKKERQHLTKARRIPDPDYEGETYLNPEYMKSLASLTDMDTRRGRLKVSNLDNVYDHNTKYDREKKQRKNLKAILREAWNGKYYDEEGMEETLLIFGVF